MTEQRPQRVADSIHKKGIRMKRTPTPIRLIGALAILGLSSAGQAATFSLVAVAVNGEPITPTDFVTVNPGDVIECEIHIAGWADDNWCPGDHGFQACSSDADCPEGCREFLVRIYQATIDAAGYVSSESGVLRPIGWDRPFPTGNRCETDADCGKGIECQHGRCQLLRCRGDDDCLEGMECILSNPRHTFGTCYGPNHDPELGAYIDEGRSDFVFFGFDEIVITAVSTGTSAYSYGGLQFDETSGAVDIGQSAYVGTLLLAPSDIDDYQGEACGSFVVTFDPNYNYTFLESQWVPRGTLPSRSWSTLFVPRFGPLTINVAEVGACIYPDRACVEACEVTRATCATTGGLWNPGRSCPDRLLLGDGKRSPASRDE